MLLVLVEAGHGDVGLLLPRAAAPTQEVLGLVFGPRDIDGGRGSAGDAAVLAAQQRRDLQLLGAGAGGAAVGGAGAGSRLGPGVGLGSGLGPGGGPGPGSGGPPAWLRLLRLQLLQRQDAQGAEDFVVEVQQQALGSGRRLGGFWCEQNLLVQEVTLLGLQIWTSACLGCGMLGHM